MEDQDLATIQWDSTLSIQDRDVIAVEHPLAIKNIHNGIKTFGLGQPFDRIMDERNVQGCIPLYIRSNDPLCPPLLSANTSTRNVLLKITVPKRTGRKRKRGTDGPFVGEYLSELPEEIVARHPLRLAPTGMHDYSEGQNAKRIRSQKRLDKPLDVLRALHDNVANYTMEAVADIPYTHRFRAPANFQHSTNQTELIPKIQELMVPGEIDGLRKFAFNKQKGWRNNSSFLPPPTYTNEALPANWTGFVNDGRPQYSGNKPSSQSHRIKYVTFDIKEVPLVTELQPPTDDIVKSCIVQVKAAFDERPVWTRRALLSHLQSPLPKYFFDHAIAHCCYQFKSGPFREAIVKFGIDPRIDPAYYGCQTIIFADRKQKGRWADPRENTEAYKGKFARSHIFDGKNLYPDGSVWQICDIEDPIIANMFDSDDALRDHYDGDAQGDGYISNGVLAKARTIMKAKINAISEGIHFTDESFASSLKFPNCYEHNKKRSREILFLVPDMAPTQEEVELLKVVEKNIPIQDLGNDARRRRIKIAEREVGKGAITQPKEKLRRQRAGKKNNSQKGQESETPGEMATSFPMTLPPRPQGRPTVTFADDLAIAAFDSYQDTGGIQPAGHDLPGGYKDTWNAQPGQPQFEPQIQEFASQEQTFTEQLLHSPPRTFTEQLLDSPGQYFTEQLGDSQPQRFTAQPVDPQLQYFPPPPPQSFPILPQQAARRMSQASYTPQNAGRERIGSVACAAQPMNLTPKQTEKRKGKQQETADDAEENYSDCESDQTDIVDFSSVALKKLPGPPVF
ncbi:RNA polymerase III transcription factor IIIC subunit-domain-containing protein [Calycina marina]|uniref:RNA polymerase III transcription factor IIIC subunit-domain-containing protein n=1 Tax=Calycina marina TaxID=1763456 RepID=A0A9P7Z6E0_9HELO|nr:RNA polymerase III transcription factor IIIC subunit-domain-containing protein [Calycina marina]